jgi:hypothetical protein
VVVPSGTAETKEKHVMKRLSVIAAVVALFGVGAVAQQQVRPAQPSGQQQRAQGQMSMEDMMKGCREHCETAMKSTDTLAKTIADAKASNDPAKMRAALEQAEKPLADMRQHMNMCMNMMTMMQKMHGGGANR